MPYGHLTPQRQIGDRVLPFLEPILLSPHPCPSPFRSYRGPECPLCLSHFTCPSVPGRPTQNWPRTNEPCTGPHAWHSTRDSVCMPIKAPLDVWTTRCRTRHTNPRISAQLKVETQCVDPHLDICASKISWSIEGKQNMRRGAHQCAMTESTICGVFVSAFCLELFGIRTGRPP